MPLGRLLLGEIDYDLNLNIGKLQTASLNAEKRMDQLNVKINKSLDSMTKRSEAYAKNAIIAEKATLHTLTAIDRATASLARKRTSELDAEQKGLNNAAKKEQDWLNKRQAYWAAHRKTLAAQQRNYAKDEAKSTERLDKKIEESDKRRAQIETRYTELFERLGVRRQRALLREQMAEEAHTNKVVADYKRQQEAIRRTAYDYQRLGSGIHSFARTSAVALGLVVAPIAALIKSGAQIASSMSLAERGFTKLTGSTRQAATMMKQLKDETVYSFLTLQQTLPLAQRLSGAFGPRQIGRAIPALRAIGGAAVAGGGGFNEQQRAVGAITSMLSRQQISQRYIQQLSNALPMARIGDILQRQFGTSIAADLKKQGHSAEEVIIAILNDLDKRFGDYQKKLTRTTLPGLISGITDSFQLLGAELTQRQMPKIIHSLQQMFDALESLRRSPESLEAVGKLLDAILSPLDKLISTAASLVKWFSSLSQHNQNLITGFLRWSVQILAVNTALSLLLGTVVKTVGWAKLLGINLKDITGWFGKGKTAAEGATTALEGASVASVGLLGWLKKLIASPWIIRIGFVAAVAAAANLVNSAYDKAISQQNLRSEEMAGSGSGLATNMQLRSIISDPKRAARTRVDPNVFEQAERLYRSQFGARASLFNITPAQKKIMLGQLGSSSKRLASYGAEGLPTGPPKPPPPDSDEGSNAKYINQIRAMRNQGELARANSITDPTARAIALIRVQTRQIIREREEQAKNWIAHGIKSQQQVASELAKFRSDMMAKETRQIQSELEKQAKARQTLADNYARKQINTAAAAAHRLPPGRTQFLTLEGVEETRLNLNAAIMKRGKSQDERVQIERDRLEAIHQLHLFYGKKIDDYEEKRRQKEITAQLAIAKREEQINIDIADTQLKILEYQQKILGKSDFEGQRQNAVSMADRRADINTGNYNIQVSAIQAKMDAEKNPDIKAQYMRQLDKLAAEQNLKDVENDTQLQADLEAIDEKEQSAIAKRLSGLTDYYDDVLRAFSKRTKYDSRPENEILGDKVGFRRQQMTKAALNNPLVTMTDWWQQQLADNEQDTEHATQVGNQAYYKYLENQAKTIQEKDDYLARTRESDETLTPRGRLQMMARYGIRGTRRRDAQAQLQAADLGKQLESRMIEDRKHGVETPLDIVKYYKDQIEKLTKPRSIWDDLKEDANKKFGNIVESFSDAVGQMAAKGGSLKSWWKNLWGDMVSWFASFVVRNVMEGVANMVTGGGGQRGGGGGFGGILSSLGSLFGIGGKKSGGGSMPGDMGFANAIQAPWETGQGTPPFAPTGGPMGAVSQIGGLAGLFSKGGIKAIGSKVWGWAAANPWIAGLAGAYLLRKPLGQAWKGIKKVGSGIWKGVKKLFHFDDPMNDASAATSGRDFTALFAKGVARGMAQLTAHSMHQNGGMMALMGGTGAGRQMLARMGGYNGSSDSPVIQGKNEYHFHQPTFLNRQMMDEMSDNVDRNLAEKIRLRSGRGSFAGRDRR